MANNELTYQDAIALLRAEYLESLAVYVATDDSDSMHMSNVLKLVLKTLEQAKKENVLNEEAALSRAVAAAAALSDYELEWTGDTFELLDDGDIDDDE